VSVVATARPRSDPVGEWRDQLTARAFVDRAAAVC